jgi:hypothetical protein
MVMTLVTHEIMSTIYSTDVRLELLYMPINSEEFYNNGLYEAVYAIFPLSILIFTGIGVKFFRMAQEWHEEELK